MVTITDSAKKELKRIVEDRTLDAGKYLRLATPPMWLGEGDFGIVIGEEGSHDHVIKHEGVDVLLVDATLHDELPNSVLDFKDFPEGSRFTLDVY